MITSVSFNVETLENNKILQKELRRAGLKQLDETNPALCAYLGIPHLDNFFFKNGTTQLHFAALGGQKERMESLLREGGIYHRNAVNKNGACFIHYLALGGRLDMLKEYYDPLVLDDKGYSCAEYAFLGRDINALRWLCEKKNPIAQILYLTGFIKNKDYFFTDSSIKTLKLINKKAYLLEIKDIKPIQLAIAYLVVFIKSKLYIMFNEDHSDTKKVLEKFSGKDLDTLRLVTNKIENELNLIDKELILNIKNNDTEECISIEEVVSILLDSLLDIPDFDLSKYKNFNKLGYNKIGTFGSVYKIENGEKTYAIKIVKNTLDTDNFWDENAIYNKFISADPEGKMPLGRKIDLVWKKEVGALRPCFVLEAYQSDLYEVIFQKNFALDFHFIKKVLIQIVQACLFLKELGLIHGDLKTLNILYNPPFKVAVTDFGSTFAKKFPPIEYTVIDSDLQTTWYRSPECMVYALPYGYEADVWTLGCIIAELVKRDFLFTGDEAEIVVKHQNNFGSYPERFKVIKSEKFPSFPEVQQKEIGALEDLLESSKRTNKRKFDAVESVLFTQCIDLAKNCLQLDPNNRMSIEDIAKHPFLQRTNS